MAKIRRPFRRANRQLWAHGRSFHRKYWPIFERASVSGARFAFSGFAVTPGITAKNASSDWGSAPSSRLAVNCSRGLSREDGVHHLTAYVRGWFLQSQCYDEDFTK